MLEESSIGKAGARREDVQATRQRLAGMEEFMEVTNKIFQQFIGNARSGLTKVVRVLLKAF
jgi:tetrahydromethanopterin S-methyltransferase subunit G